MRLLAYPHVRLIYNGEIYNCREVQKEYGFNYESRCDGEAIIHLYVRFGAEKNGEDAGWGICLRDRGYEREEGILGPRLIWYPTNVHF